MSHFTVMVVGEKPEEALAPYQENNMGDCPREYLEFEIDVAAEDIAKEAAEIRKGAEGKDYGAKYATMTDGEVVKDYNGGEFNEKGDLGSWRNPNAKWDWYQIGGRWAGSLKLKEGADGTKGTQSWMQRMQGTEYPEGCADQAYKGDIDVEGMRNEAGLKAQREYEAFEAIVAEHGPLPDDEWRKLDHSTDAFKEAKKAYWEHPTVKAIQEANLIGWMSLPTDEFRETKEQYVEKARNGAILAYAMLIDGEWIEPGEMGWFGSSSETPESRVSYYEEANKRFDALPDDTLITMVDCHI